jgi:ribosomal protein S18 acetylase RimI-like enzyme
MMALDPARLDGRMGRRGDAPATPDVTVERVHHMAGPAAEDAARGIAIVLAEAFRIEPERLGAIEAEMEVLLGRESFYGVLVRVDGEPAATARRTTFAGASYLSSIGTRPRFQGRGLGRLASAVAMYDAVEAGSRWTYLGVFDDNLVARRMYEDLGFVVLGGPSPDLLLR